MVALETSLQTGPDKPAPTFLRKYAPLLAAAAIFFLLAFAVLTLNFRAATTTKVSALSINLAGRQRMLSQRLVKALLQTQSALRESHPPAEALKEVVLAQKLFDTTLQGFDVGGTVVGGDGSDVFLPAITYAPARVPLAAATELWGPYKRQLAPVLTAQAAAAPVTNEALAGAIAYGTAHNLKLLAFMNEMTFKLEEDSRHRASVLQSVQVVVFLAMLLDAGFFLYYAFGRLRRSDQAEHDQAARLAAGHAELAATTASLKRAKAETDSIFNTVREGLCLLDTNYLVSEQYSQELHDILGGESPAGKNLLHLLKQRITEKEYTTACEYFALLFNADRREKQVLKINPLAQIEAHFPEAGGGLIQKTLQFQFRRVYHGQEVERLFVSVTDISQQIRLEQRLREAELKKERQLELLLAILNVEPARLAEFIETAEREMERTTLLLKAGESGAGEVGPRTLDGLFRNIHNLKGNAALLGLTQFEQAAHEMESIITDLRSKPGLTGNNLLPVVVRQASFVSDLAEVRELVDKLSGLKFGFVQPAADSGDDFIEPLADLASSLAAKQGKAAQVDTTGFDPTALSAARRSLVRDICIQLTRNALTHGIELPGEREQLGKPQHGTIRLCRLPPDAARPGYYSFTFRDDGRGLQFDKIRERAVRTGLLAHGQKTSSGRLAALIFEPGFTTAETVTTDAGRGIGMDIIKRRVVDESGGEIKVLTSPGLFCEFQFHLPV